jgi:hypothetical protein
MRPVGNSKWLSCPPAGRSTVPKTRNGAVRRLVALPGQCKAQTSPGWQPADVHDVPSVGICFASVLYSNNSPCMAGFRRSARLAK